MPLVSSSTILDSGFLNYIKSKYRIVVIDTEFQFDRGMSYVRKPICIVMKDLTTNQVYKFWDQNNGSRELENIFSFDNTIFVCHYAVAEVGYFLSKFWGRPAFIFDTWTEYAKLYKNIRPSLNLLSAATAYGYKTPTSAEDKDRYRDMCINQNTWTREEQEGILKYCLDDVLMTEHIFYGLLQDLENTCGKDYEILLEQALARGQSMACVAKAQHNGIPVDNNLISDFNLYWNEVKASVIQRFNKKLQLWDSDSKFSNAKFAELIKRLDLFAEWPRTPKGKLKTNSDTLELFADIFPEIKQLKRIFNLLNSAKLAEYIISEDGRYRPNNGFKMFGTHTGRCTPSSKWIFGTAKWGRNFMKPSFGNVLVYLDYKSEEPFVSAQLSGDTKLLEAYNSGDVYLHTAKFAGAVPPDATKQSHPEQRKIFKVIVLASNYGMGVRSIAKSLKKFNITASEAAGLLKQYKNIYKVYFDWVERRSNHALMNGFISTSLGWDRRFRKGSPINPRSLMNWSIQSEAAEILRNALIRLTDAHIKVCAMVHDAFLIECPIPEHIDQINIARRCMVEAAEYIVGGTIQVDADIHWGNFKQEAADQEIFNNIFEEINNYKKRKQGQVSAQSVVKGLSINY